MNIVIDSTFAVLFGIVLRFIIVVLFMITIGKVFKIKNTPSLPPILGAIAIVYYFSLDEEYAHLEYINGFVILGMFLPEVFKLTDNAIKSKKAEREKT
jgi:hypothetical protein